MNRRQVSQFVFSALLVVALLTPDVARAAQSVTPQPRTGYAASPAPNALPNPFLNESSALAADKGYPPAQDAPPAEAAPAAAEPAPNALIAPLGRLLFAPVIDADGDPTTNPVETTPAPVINLAGQTVGLIELAAQVAPAASNGSRLNVPVTFWVWEETADAKHSSVVYSQTVQSDAWGAVSVEVPLKETGRNYAYQAQAPGYGSTEARYFRFDEAQAFYTIHEEGAQLSVTPLGDGKVLFVLESTLLLQAGRDEPALVLARRPEGIAGESASANTEQPLEQPVFDALNRNGGLLPFPRVNMQIVGPTTAQVEVQLPSGDYRFLGAADVYLAEGAHRLFSAPVELRLDSAAAKPPSSAPVWVATLEHDTNRRLVRYQSPAGQAIFALVAADQTPQVASAWDGESLMVKTWRTAPFEYRQETYLVQVNRPATENPPQIALSYLDYDPIARRYTVALQSLQSHTVTETFQVEVYGPANADTGNPPVIWSQSSQVVLQPGQVSEQKIETPVERGQPQGMRVTLDDAQAAAPDRQMSISLQRIDTSTDTVFLTDIAASPEGAVDDGLADYVTTYYSKMVIFGRSVAKFLREHVQTSLRFYLEILEVEIVAWGYAFPPDKWQKIPETIDWYALFWQIWDSVSYQMWIDRKVALVTGGIQTSITFSGQLDFGQKCQDGTAKEILRQSITAFAAQLNHIAEQLPLFAQSIPPGNELKYKIRVGPGPVVWALMWWIEGQAGVRVVFSADGLALVVGGQIFADVSVNIGWDATAFFTDPQEYLGLYVAVSATYGVIRLVTMFGSYTYLAISGSCEKVDPDKKPADDRQDAWQSVGNAASQNPGDTIDELTLQVGRARTLGLWRAERALTVELRQAEAERFASNAQATLDYYQQVTDIALAANAEVRGILSGTIPISPSSTITEAIFLHNQHGAEALASLPYAIHLRTLEDNLEIAQQAYTELYGQELELQHELRQLYLTSSVGVINAGFLEGTLKALQGAGVPAQLISLWPGAGDASGVLIPYLAPQDAPRALVMPSGGMTEIATSAEGRAWLEAYVSGGGLLIVFAQAFGSDWQSLPGGQVRGVGYDEDQRCEQESVRALAASNWLVWMGDDTPDIQVDGVFTAWPANATLLLARTSGVYQGYPAMLEYAFGQGRVLATSAYGDWAVQSAIWWGDDWQMTRSLLIRAYLLINGQDVEDLLAVTPDTDFSFTLPITNTSPFTSTTFDIWLPKFVGIKSISAGQSYPLTLAPGESSLITATLHAPPAWREVHNWTQVGLFPVRTRLANDIDGGYHGWGPFVLSQSPIAPASVSLFLTSAQPAYLPFSTAVVTAVVHNYTADPQTITLRGVKGLPNTPIVLIVPAFGEATADYTVSMDASKQLRATIANELGQQVGEARLSLHLASPHLRAAPEIVPPLDSGAPVTVTVTNQPLELSPAAPSVSATLALSLTAPSGALLWSATQPLPPLAQSQSTTLVFTLGDPGPITLGEYQLTYRFYESGAPTRSGVWPLPARLVLQGDFDQPEYAVGDTPIFTATLHNPGFFDLSPLVTITIPTLDLTFTQQISPSAEANAAFAITFTLPLTMLAQTYPVNVTADQNASLVTQSYSFSISPAQIAAALAAGPYTAGETLTVTLANVGGGGAELSHILQLADHTGLVLAQTTGGEIIYAGEQTTLTLQIPSQAASGDYRLQVVLTDQTTQQQTLQTFAFPVSGMAAELAVFPTQPQYLAGETVQAMGTVTAAQGVLSGTLLLEATRAGATSIQTIESGQVNSNDEGGYYRDNRYPAIAVDAAGNAYAVYISTWVYATGNSYPSLRFAYRPAGGRWELLAEEIIAGVTTDTGSPPSIAVDATGNAYVVWEDNRTMPSGSTNSVYLRIRSADGTWSDEEQVNDVLSAGLPEIALDPAGNAYIIWTNWGTQTVRFSYRSAGGVWSPSELVSDTDYALRGAASLAVDAAGNAYAIWEDARTFDDIYFSYRPAGGAWEANIRINDNAGNSARGAPAIAVDAAGNASAVWRDQRSGVHIYYASRPAGGAWSANVRVSTATGADVPDVALDAGGNVYVAWRTSASDIFAAVKPVGGAWGTPQRVDDSTRGAQSNPAVAATPSGEVVAVWDDGRNSYSTPAKYDIYSSTRAAGGTTWSANTIVNQGGGAAKANPSLAVDSAGNIYASFTDYRYNDQNIYFNTHPVTDTWGLNTRADDGTGTTQQSSSSLGVAPNGDSYLVWEDYRSGATNSDIRFSYRPAGGAWTASARVNDDATTRLQTSPVIAVDGSGNAYALWKDYRNSTTAPDLYFSYRPAGGSWSANARVNDFATSNVSNPDLAIDASGNAYAIWNDRRDGVDRIYFSYRPAGGAWGANQRVDDSSSAATEPAIAVDADGVAYALWVDARSGVSQVYFASRPVGGLWSASQAVESSPDSIGRSNPNLVIDPAGILYAGWDHPYLFNGFYYNRLNLAARLPGAAWSAAIPVPTNYPGTDFALALDLDRNLLVAPCCVYWAVYRFTFGGETPLWSDSLTVNTPTSQPISDTVGTLGAQPGKYWLHGELQNSLGQSMASSRQSFYIFPTGVGLTLGTNQSAFLPGETITVSGRLTNTQSTTATLSLAVTANGQIILSQDYTLPPYQGVLFSTAITSTENVLFLATAGAAQASHFVIVAAPQVTATLHTPEVAAYESFSATLTFTNTGNLAVSLEGSLAGGLPQAWALAPGEVGFIARSVSITQTATLTATLRGDVTLDLAQEVRWGLRGALALFLPDSGFSGPTAVGYVITVTGELPTPAWLVYQLDGGGVFSETVTLLAGEVFSGSLLVDIPEGHHTLSAELRDAQGALLDADSIELVVNEPAAPQEPDIQIVDVAVSPLANNLEAVCDAPTGYRENCPFVSSSTDQAFQVAVTIANRGPAAPIITALQVFDDPQQWIITPTAYLTQTYVLTFSVPTDLPADDYPAQISIFDQQQVFMVNVAGADVGMALALDQPVYLEGEPAALNVTLSEQAGLDGDYRLSLRYLDAEELITVTVPANQVVVHTFVFTATESNRASVSLAFTPAAGEDSQRTIMIDSLSLQVVDPASGATLQLDKLVYQAGETIQVTATLTGVHNSIIVAGPLGLGLQDSDYLAWSPPYAANGQSIAGVYNLSVTLPVAVRSGQYSFLLAVDGDVYNTSFDVQGYSVTARRVMLDKATYNPQDSLAATVEFWNDGDAPIEDLRLTAWVFLPDQQDILPLTPEVSQTVTLQPGMNVFTVTGVISTPVVGPHILGIMVGVPGQPWQVVRSFTQFAVGSAHLVSLTTDHGNYAPGQTGVGQLDVYGYGPTTLVVTATTGATLLDTQANLSGFETFTFTIPTDAEGDYLLAARSADAQGNADQLLRAYAVPPAMDTQAPVITLLSPYTTTHIASSALTMTLPIEGIVSDNDAAADLVVIVNGQWLTPQADGTFTATTTLRQGFNMLSVAAYDPAGNITYAPMVHVYLLPAHGMDFSADSPVAIVGETITFQAVLTATGVLSDVSFSLPLPTVYITSPIITTNNGQGAISALEPNQFSALWQGNLAAGQPTLITVTAIAAAPGVMIPTASAAWGWGLNQQFTATVAIETYAPQADLSVVVVDAPDPVFIGELLTYTATVTNHGPATAENVILTATLPAEVSFVSVSSSCALFGNGVYCEIGALASGASAVVIIVVLPVNEGGVTSLVTVSSSQLDLQPENNSVNVDTTILTHRLYLPIVIKLR